MPVIGIDSVRLTPLPANKESAMSRFVKDGLTIETSIATEAAELRRDGFIEQKAAAPKPAPVKPAPIKTDK